MRLPSPPRLLAPLADTRLGVLLGLGLAALLVLASFMVPDPRGEHPLPFSESLLVFFDPPAARFWWFYLLAGTAVLWGLNLLLGSWNTLAARSRGGGLDRRAWAVTGMHLGALLGLVAHLQAGLTAGAEGRAMLSSAPVTLAGHALVLERAELVQNGDGSLRGVDAIVSVDGASRSFGYNDPLWLDGFTRWVLLQGPEEQGGLPRFEWAGEELPPSADGALGDAPWVVRRVSTNPSLRAPMALLMQTQTGQESWLALGDRTADGLAFTGLEPQLLLSVVLHRNDGLPLLGLGMVVFLAGLGLFLPASRA